MRAVACFVMFEAIIYNVWFGGAERCLNRGLELDSQHLCEAVSGDPVIFF